MELSVSRRSLLKAGAALAVVGATRHAIAKSGDMLTIDSRILDVNGKSAKVFGIANQFGKFGLTNILGQSFDVQVRNALSEETLIHWHGLTPPSAMDGVAMLSGPVMKPQSKRDYLFENKRSGTHWMHSHLGLQEQQLLAAPLIVKELEESLFDEQEHVVMLHDFTFRDPAEILQELRGGGGAHAAHGAAKPAAVTATDHSQHGASAAAINMVSDVVFDAMLANDRTLSDPEVVQAERGGRFRLRIINGAAATNLWIDLGALEGALIAVDGNAVYPVSGRRFPLAIAQRADIRLTLPAGPGAYPILFQSEGTGLRAGVILRAGDAAVSKLSDQGEPGPALDLALESKLKSVLQFRDEPVTRTEMLMLTGGGSDYVWGLNNQSSMHDILFRVSEGDRIDIMMHNMTGMAHPMHLHGHYFKVVAIGDKAIDGAVRDTVLVPVGQTVTIRFDADNPGTWAFHCHHLYHMNSGMMGAIGYTGAA